VRALGGLAHPADLTADPRLLLVAAGFDHDTLRLAGRIARPEIEMVQATLARAGAESALLLESAAPLAPPPLPSASVDPLLFSLPPGLSRSLMRRVLEPMRGSGFRFVPLEGGVDVERDGRLLGSLLAAASGVEARRADGRSIRIGTDQDCLDAARFFETGSGAMAAPAIHPAPPEAAALPLTPDELAELERGLPPEDPARACATPLPAEN
jgi:hypothetical protein